MDDISGIYNSLGKLENTINDILKRVIPLTHASGNGFVWGANYYQVAHSDADAYVCFSFIPTKTRQYTLRIFHASVTAVGAVDNGYLDMSLNDQVTVHIYPSGNLALTNGAANLIVYTDCDLGAYKTLTKDVLTKFLFQKSDNGGGAAGNFQIHGMMLVALD